MRQRERISMLLSAAAHRATLTLGAGAKWRELIAVSVAELSDHALRSLRRRANE